jgi:hypothetical protein
MPQAREAGPARRQIRPAVFGANVLAAHAATWAVAERLGAGVAAVEVLLAVIVILTALFGPDKFSDRAFRLLRRDAPRRAGRRAAPPR